jgi:hypothetical protein
MGRWGNHVLQHCRYRRKQLGCVHVVSHLMAGHIHRIEGCLHIEILTTICRAEIVVLYICMRLSRDPVGRGVRVPHYTAVF